MFLFLKDVALEDHRQQSNKLHPNGDEFYPASFNASLYGIYNQYLKYDKVINRLKISEDKRKQYNDSNLILFIVQNKIMSNLILTDSDEVTIDIIDDCIYYGNTVFGNVNPDMNFLRKICKKHELTFDEADCGLTFSANIHNKKEKSTIKTLKK